MGALLPGLVMAQDPDATYDMMITVGGEASPEVPDNTVSLSVLSEDESTEYGSCLLSIHTKPNGCSLTVPASTTVVAVVDESTLPAGIVPVENPIAYTTPAEGFGMGDITFEFVYAGDDDTGAPEDPVDQLPSTGSGAHDDRMVARSGVMNMSLVAAGLAIVAFISSALTRMRS